MGLWSQPAQKSFGKSTKALKLERDEPSSVGLGLKMKVSCGLNRYM